MPESATSNLQATAADLDLLRRGAAYANACVVADIQSACVRVNLPNASPRDRWYDTRPMLDANEHAPQVLDMATEAIAYAVDAGLVVRHPNEPHFVCLVAAATAF